MSRFALLIAVSCLVLAAPGCAKFDLGEDFALWKTEPKPQVPESLIAVWTESVLHQPGKPPVRGFGGRLLFHGEDPGEEESHSVMVEGNLVVYAYDNARADPDSPAPDKKFVFPANNLALHQSESNLGPSYSFWLPWDEVGGPQRQISLLARFEDKSGQIVMSSMAHVTLSGPFAAMSPGPGPARFPGAPGPPSPALGNVPVRGGAAGSWAGPPGDPGYVGVPPSYGMTGWPDSQLPPAGTFGVQQVEYEASVTGPAQETAPPKSKAPMHTVTIDVAPGQARRLLATSNGGASPQADAPPSRSQPPADRSDHEASLAEATSRPEPTTTDSAHGPSPARSLSPTRSTTDPVRRQPFRGEWPQRLPPTPRFGTTRSVPAPTAEER